MLKVLDWTQKEPRRIDPTVFSYLLSEWGEESAHTSQQCFMTERCFKSSFSHSSQWCRIYSGRLCIRIKIRKLVGKFSPRSHRLTARNPSTASRLRLGNTRKPMSVTGCLRMTQGKPWFAKVHGHTSPPENLWMCAGLWHMETRLQLRC